MQPGTNCGSSRWNTSTASSGRRVSRLTAPAYPPAAGIINLKAAGGIMSDTPNIHIEGNVSADILNIGGTQTIHLAPKPRTCPPPPENPAQFGGRDKALETLLAKLKAGEDGAITAVQGMGGMGKTTLAKVL